MSVVVLSACFSTIYGTNSNEPVPHWENLECEVNETKMSTLLKKRGSLTLCIFATPGTSKVV